MVRRFHTGPAKGDPVYDELVRTLEEDPAPNTAVGPRLTGTTTAGGSNTIERKKTDFRNPMQDYADIIVGGKGGAPVRLAKGTEGQVLTVTDIGAGVLRLTWEDPTGGGGGAGGFSIPYVFSTLTTNSDPGSGILRLNNATESSATAIYLDLLDANATDWTTALDTFDDSTSTVKGHILLFGMADPSNWILFTISAVVSHTGYREFTVTVVDSSASNPFADTDDVMLAFVRTGDKGDTGATGAAGAAGSNGTNGTDGAPGGGVAIPYTFSTTTTNSDPGNGVLRLDNATQNASTTIRADLLDNDGNTVTAVLDSLDDSTNTVKGHIRLYKKSDPTKWLLFTVSAVDSSSGYRNITVALVASSAANPFSASDVLILAFTRAGDMGFGQASGVNAFFDGGGTTLSSSITPPIVRIPYACTVTGWTIHGDSGDAVVDVQRATYGGAFSSIAGSEKPTLVGASWNTDTSLSTWTTSLSAGDHLKFIVESTANLTYCAVDLLVNRV